ncbi:MAG: hypothetical protein ACI4L7_00480 [Christensenellales bacterium]
MNIENAFAKVKLNTQKNKACANTLGYLLHKYGWGPVVLAYLTGEDPTTHEYYCSEEVFDAYVQALESGMLENIEYSNEQEGPTPER